MKRHETLTSGFKISKSPKRLVKVFAKFGFDWFASPGFLAAHRSCYVKKTASDPQQCPAFSTMMEFVGLCGGCDLIRRQ